MTYLWLGCFAAFATCLAVPPLAGAADWTESNDPAVIAAQAESELKGTPKSVKAALSMVHLYNGFALATQKALSSRPVPDIRDAGKANHWKQRIIEACKEPTTLHCGNDITFRRDGTISSFGLMDVIGMGDGKGGDSGIPRTNGFFQPITLRFVDGLRTVKATAARCGVRGLGLGEDPPGPKAITDTWIKPLEGFRKLTGTEPNFVVECLLPRTFFEPNKDGNVIELAHRELKLHVRGATYASYAIWRLEPKYFLLVAAVPEKPLR